MRADQLAVVRECLNRQRPFGKTDCEPIEAKEAKGQVLQYNICRIIFTL
jgi:hypothetical protein